MAVRALAGGAELEVVWVNELGGVTFRVGEGPARRFIKWTPAGSGIDLAEERRRLAWARRFIAVPRVLGDGSDAEGSWLITSPLDGQSAVSERWLADRASAVAGIGRGLRRLHDLLPTLECPFSWSAPTRLAVVKRLARRGMIEPKTWHPEHRHLTIEAAIERVADPPGLDRLVVCHGDACSPNTILRADGNLAGHVDLGSLGLGDRWADLAVASWSAGWNYGPEWENEVLAAYGIEPDPGRIAYYRLLWDLGP